MHLESGNYCNYQCDRFDAFLIVSEQPGSTIELPETSIFILETLKKLGYF